MSDEELRNEVEFVTKQIDLELEKVEGLFTIAKKGALDQIQSMAAATVLHSIYNGIESIFSRIYKAHRGFFKEDGQWHRKLLDLVAQNSKEGLPIISEDVLSKLNDYLAFRHRFRHSYGWQLDPSIIQTKLLELPNLWKQLKSEIWFFLEKNTINNEGKD